MKCPNCGEEINDNSKFCSVCGYSITGVEPAGNAKGSHMSIEILKKSFEVILKKPFRLWGLSLMGALLSIIATIFAGPVVGISIAIDFVLKLGMAWIFLDGYRDKEVSSNQLFEPFKHFWKSFAGMGWMNLWVLIWSLIPFAGLVFGVIKGYAYSLTPYILRENDEMSPNDALKKSMDLTKGYKGNMFITDLIFCLCIFVPVFIFALLGRVPYVGVVFNVILVLVVLVICAFGGLFTGLIKAAWYDEITKAAEE